MRFTIAASVLTATNGALLVSSAENPATRERGQRVAEHIHARNSLLQLPRYETAKTSPLTNRTEEFSFSRNDSDERIDDIGILSSSFRELSPVGVKNPRSNHQVVPERMSSPAFDLFGVVDENKTNFGFLCTSEIYDCTTCDTIGDDFVGSFQCQTPETAICYDIESPCPNDVLSVCRNDTLRRTMYNDSVEETNENDAWSTGSYFSERCRKIDVELTKTDRSLYQDEESAWNFSYCMRYNISSTQKQLQLNTCEMEVDGIICSSCRLETLDTIAANSTSKRFCATFDCGNTFLGYSGRFCNGPKLARGAMDYFVYRSLPCDGGCNLCDVGEGTTNSNHTMAFRESDFPFDMLSKLPSASLPVSLNCFEQQWKALTDPPDESFCERVGPFAQIPCGCSAPMKKEVGNLEEKKKNERTSVSSAARIGISKKTTTAVILTALAWTWLIDFSFIVV